MLNKLPGTGCASVCFDYAGIVRQMLMSLFIKPRTSLIITLIAVHFPFTGFANETHLLSLSDENPPLLASEFAENLDKNTLISQNFTVTNTAFTRYEPVLNKRLDLKEQYFLLSQGKILEEKYDQKQINDLGIPMRQ